MSVRPCLLWPDPRLRAVVEPVAEITDEVRGIWQDMIDTMEAMPGVGLAAPQIGISKRLIVVDASTSRNEVLRMANPEILVASEKLRGHEEASPNLPHVHARISRPAEVTVIYLNEHGIRDRRQFEGLWATSVQHQIDHLNGKLYFHHLSKIKRDMLIRKSKKARA